MHTLRVEFYSTEKRPQQVCGYIDVQVEISNREKEYADAVEKVNNILPKPPIVVCVMWLK